MTRIAEESLRKKQARLEALRADRLPWWNIWRDLADNILPKRYVWLLSDRERKRTQFTNPAIIDGTGTQAARIMAAGLMNGIASPSRPWFKFRLKNFSDDVSYASRLWLDEVERRMRYVISRSNFYNALAVYFLDLCVFGTSAFSIFEDDDTVIHCQNHALGEFYVDVDGRGKICLFAREFSMTVYQMVREFGEENVSQPVRDAYKAGGARWNESRLVTVMLEHNYEGEMPAQFSWVESVWEQGWTADGSGKVNLLRQKGYIERPTIVTRWEVSANDAYGTSPGMDALGDIKQLQFESKQKAKGLELGISPPMLADIRLQNKPFALLPRGITYVAALDANSGARAAYTPNLALGELTQDISLVQQRVANIFYNFLFNKVMNLPTVRSAREIDSIEGEKLVLLGSALERVENEGLDPQLERIYGIMFRKGMFPPVPEELRKGDNELEIEYVSVLAAAQSAAGTASVERWLQIIGTIVGVWPEVREIPEIVDLITQYGKDIGVSQKGIRSRDTIAAIVKQGQEQQQQQQRLDQAGQLADAAATASQADIGGGQNALQLALQGR